MAIVNKFNVNNKQVTLDADIIENMSANDVSYNDSSKYDKNTVGNKLSKLESEIDVFKKDVTDEVTVFKETVTEQVNNYKPIVINGNVTNASDEEDLTSVDGLLKFKNRSSLNGMGYVILRKDKSFAEQVTKENTIYEIRYNFVLNENITIPTNCMLKFDGGSISGAYTLTGQNTSIKAGLVKIFGSDIVISGTWNNKKVSSEWFDAALTNFYKLIIKLIAICDEYGTILVNRDTTLSDTDPYKITLTKSYNFDFCNTTLTLGLRQGPLPAGDYKNLFLANRQDKVIKGLKFENLNIEATANIEETGQFSGMTSGWAFAYISNIDGCVLKNINFNHADVGFKFGYYNGNNLGRKNIIIDRCTLVGKMLLLLYDTENVLVKNCIFDNSDATNKYDHCIYGNKNLNTVVTDCVYKNSLSALNFWNAGSITKKYDIENIKIINSKFYNVNVYLNMSHCYNVIIDNIIAEDIPAVSKIFNIWNSKCVIINNVHINSDSTNISDLFNVCEFIQINNLYYHTHKCILQFIGVKNAIINNSNLICASDNRLIIASQNTILYLLNSIIDVKDSESQEFLMNDDNASYEDIFIVDNCRLLATGGLKDKLLFRIPCINKNTIIRNSYVEFKLQTTNTSKCPSIFNCRNNNGKIQDFPYCKSAATTIINNTITPNLENGDEGFTLFDKTRSKQIMWNGSNWVNVDGSSLS